MSKFLRLASGLVALLIAASAAAADPAKLLRISFPVAETGFDPVRVSDLYSNIVNEAIFERLLTYDYLARPAKLVPMTAETMPEVSEGGRTYIVHLKRGIYFAPSQFETSFISTAHTAGDIEQTGAVVREALAGL